jgi:hypothetical protein
MLMLYKFTIGNDVEEPEEPKGLWYKACNILNCDEFRVVEDNYSTKAVETINSRYNQVGFILTLDMKPIKRADDILLDCLSTGQCLDLA